MAKMSTVFFPAIAIRRPSGETSQLGTATLAPGSGNPSMGVRAPSRGSRRYQAIAFGDGYQSRMHLDPDVGQRIRMCTDRRLASSGASNRTLAGPATVPSKGARTSDTGPSPGTLQ